jgi:hypothetical protein
LAPEGRDGREGLFPEGKNHYFQGMTNDEHETTKAVAGPEGAPLQGDSGDMRPAHEVFKALAVKRKPEQGGPEGQEPTTFGDWQVKGRCVDF